MKAIKKLFGGVGMSWRRVIILALLSGIGVGVLMILPSLVDTSLQDPGIYPDVWFILALFVILNCGSALEAGKKCFVFFLISQPLIYLVQVPFAALGWGLFGYYKRWFLITLLTFPGAMLAYQVKRKSWLSVLILTVATGYLAIKAADYLSSMLSSFPHHLLSTVFCLASAVLLILVLLDKKAQRTAALLIVAAAFAVTALFLCFPRSAETTIVLPEGEWSYTVYNGSVVDVDIDGNRAILTSRSNGSEIIDFTATDGTAVSYNIVVDRGNFSLSLID